MGVEILNFQSLKKANKLAKKISEKENVTEYIHRRPNHMTDRIDRLSAPALSEIHRFPMLSITPPGSLT